MHISGSQSNEDLHREVTELRQKHAAAMLYIRQKVNQLLAVMGTAQLRPEELDDSTLLELDPISIVSDSFAQVLGHVKETNEQLKIAHEEMTAIFDSAGMGILVTDRDLNVLASNRMIGEAFGIDRASTSGIRCHELICRKVPAPDCPALKAVRSGAGARSEMDLDGRHFEVVSTPIRDTDGIISRVVLVYLDMTERIRSQENLRKSEERYRDLFENSTDLIQVLNADGTIRYVNRAWMETLDYGPEDLVNKSIFDIVHPDCINCGPEFRSIVTGSTDGRFETMFITKGRETIVVEGNVSPITEGGEFVGTRGIFRDITARKQAETLMAAEREQLAVTLRSIGDGVITTDLNGAVVLINKVAERMTGWRLDEARGLPITSVFRMTDEKTGEEISCPIERVLRTGLPCELEGDAMLADRTGGRHLITDSVAPILNKDSAVAGAVLVFRDVTERRKLEDRMIKSEKIESLGVLAGGIAHDFNNLLNSIIANLDIGLKFSTPDSEVHKSLSRAQKASAKAKDLTQQLLTFSKGGAPVKKLASIADLIRDTADFGTRGTNVRCEYHLPDDLWNAEVDEGQISQVIQNLIINAVQAMPQGGVIQIIAHNVTIHSKESAWLREGDYVAISVRDHGQGIAKEHVGHIFEPYFTTKPTGSGLGLATTYSIVKKHNGAIDVESVPGFGTTFYLYLPASLHAASPVSRPPSPTPREQFARRILVMDDDELIRETVGVLLDLLGYEVAFAADGDRALDMYRKAKESGAPYDVVIMDLTIPGGRGGGVTIGDLLAFDPSAKAIVSSGYSNDAIMSNYAQNGFAGVVVKPYTMDELDAELQRVLGKK
jgi:PAS domain S-box-containing protein